MRFTNRKPPTRVVLAVLTSWLLAACGGEAAHITDVTITFDSRTSAGSVVPTGMHVDWPADLVLKLVNHDSARHELLFTELHRRYRVAGAARDEPAVAFFRLDVVQPGVYHWQCTLNCLSRDAEGYVHVATVH